MTENGSYHHFPYEVYTYDSVDSTNAVAKRAVSMIGHAADMTVHTAKRQSKGRGRLGRAWENTDGAVLMSIVRKTDMDPDSLPLLNLAAALAVRSAVAEITDGFLEPVVKWPNDLLTPDRLEKLCGILSESVSVGGELYAIVGIGLNLNCRDIPQGLLQPASSVYLYTGLECSVTGALNAILDGFEKQYNRLIKDRDAFMKDYARSCISIGRHVCVKGGNSVLYGMGESLLEDGRLVVKFEDGKTDVVSAADVSVRDMRVTDEALVRRLMPKRKHNGNKGDYGRAALIVGSFDMPGAALMCTRACLRSGAGLTRVLVPESIRHMFASIPEAVLADEDEIDALLEWASVIGVGCGMGVSDRTAALLKKALSSGKPCVIDADGLNTLAAHGELKKLLHKAVVLTPHPGEMGRLIKRSAKYVSENMTSCALSFSKEYGCTVLLKSAVSVIASPGGEVRYNETGSSALSKGGSGDVLTGVITALLAQGAGSFDAASIGAYLLGVSAEKALDLLGTRFVCAQDLTEVIEYEINGRR